MIENESQVLSSYNSPSKTKCRPPLRKELDVLSKINQSTNTIFNLMNKTYEIINPGSSGYIQERLIIIHQAINKRKSKLDKDLFDNKKGRSRVCSLQNKLKENQIADNNIYIKAKTIRKQKLKSVSVIPPIDIPSHSSYITTLSNMKNNKCDYPHLINTNTNTNTPKPIKMFYSQNSITKGEIHHNLNNRNKPKFKSPECNDRKLHYYPQGLREPNYSSNGSPTHPFKPIIPTGNHSLRKIMDQCSLQIMNGETLENELGSYSKTKAIDYNTTVNTIIKPFDSSSELQDKLLKKEINQMTSTMNQQRNNTKNIVSNSKSLESIQKNYTLSNEGYITRKMKEMMNKRTINNLLENSIKFKRMIIKKVNIEEEKHKKEIKEKALIKRLFSTSIPKLKKITINK